ncbi:MAG: hypothetical protein ACJASB_001229 [Shewanella psychromarinicola]|jgi:hypothetical protein
MILKLAYAKAEVNTKRNIVRIFGLFINLKWTDIDNKTKANTNPALTVKASTA